nr:MAG TPA: hypothetical protein [Caudoviricetes sp.]DAK60884.1 MAG TPA: hypothetical protein [Caudoviricetes sp.]
MQLIALYYNLLHFFKITLEFEHELHKKRLFL